MDCLLVRQPYASLIAFGKKRWEFRSYECKKLGEIAIAASPSDPLETLNKSLNEVSDFFPRGVILAIAEIKGSFYVTNHDLKANLRGSINLNVHGYDITTADEPLGEPLEDIQSAIENKAWESYAWLLDNIKPLKNPIAIEKTSLSTWVRIEDSEIGE